MYPFDQQICQVTFEMRNVPLIELQLEKAENYGKTSIDAPPEYEITTLGTTTNASGPSFKVKFLVKRYSSFHIFSKYLPTTLLNFIGYRTLSIPVTNFQDRGTMSLTTLLVLISL